MTISYLTHLRSQKGQGLIEVLAALAVALIVLTALTVAALTSVRNANYAKNLTQANAYARGGMDSLRAYRDANKVVFFGKVDGCYATDSSTNPLDQNWLLSAVGNSPPCQSPTGGESLGQGAFTRVVKLDTNASTCPAASTSCTEATVFVFWTDASGTNRSELTSLFGDWQTE